MKKAHLKLAGFISFLCIICLPRIYAQEFLPVQTIRGTIKDIDSKYPLIGATVQIADSQPLIGVVTDVDGNFRLNNVPVGRVTLQVNYLGYESQTIPNIVVTSGKEVILNLALTESTTQLADIVVTATENNAEPLNEMAVVSARSISMEEMNRLSTGFNDPALVTVNYAGVTNSGSGGNDIIVRGNSPKYVQWRLEGMPITNPNHFADQSAVNGSTSALNSNLLATSDFYTGAFPAEFGDVLSGVYDIKLRNGNNEKREMIFGFGLLGTDLTVEGPIKKGYGGSYLANYRYSTASALNQLGLLDVEGDPVFQDAAFKVFLPTRKYGVFSVYGLGGKSDFKLKDVTPEDWNTPGNEEMRKDIIQDYDKSSYLLNLGVNHSYSFGKNSFLETSLAINADGSTDQVFESEQTDGPYRTTYNSDLNKIAYRGKMVFHHKLNAKNKLQFGVIYTLSDYDNSQRRLLANDDDLQTIQSFNGQIGSLRSYVSWKHYLSKKFTLVAGVHNTNIFYNNKQTIEPRAALNWQLNDNNSIKIAYGLHSSMESIHHYFARFQQADGSYVEPNKNLDLLKAHHFVLGYDLQITPNLLAKMEVYYQHLYDLPVAKDSSYFVTINEEIDLNYVELVNKGKGKNYGIELTLQRFFANNYYFMVNGSFFSSKYESLDGVERNTRFNGNYAVNILGGKEFSGLGKKQNQTLNLNAKLFFGGGKKIIPLLRDAQGNLVVNPTANQFFDYSKAYEHDLEDLYMLTLSASYKWNKLKTTHELLLNLENITNNKGKLTEYYDASAPNSIGYTTQFGTLPNLMYKIYF